MIAFLLANRTLLGWVAATAGALALLFGVYQAVLHRGEMRERARWEERVKREDAKNRLTEKTLRDDVANYATKLDTAEKARAKVVTVYRDRISTAVYPECQISDGVMADRNAVRADTRLPE